MSERKLGNAKPIKLRDEEGTPTICYSAGAIARERRLRKQRDAKLREKLKLIEARVYSLEGDGGKDDFDFVQSILNECKNALLLVEEAEGLK